MAEPDYIDDDNPELIRPQKLVNPVKTSRNHQDLHRELLMNQKRYDGFLSKVFLRGLLRSLDLFLDHVESFLIPSRILESEHP